MFASRVRWVQPFLRPHMLSIDATITTWHWTNITRKVFVTLVFVKKLMWTNPFEILNIVRLHLGYVGLVKSVQKGFLGVLSFWFHAQDGQCCVALLHFFSSMQRTNATIKSWMWPSTIPFPQQQTLHLWVVRAEHCWFWVCGPLRFDNWSSFLWWRHASRWWHWCDARLTFKRWHCQCCRMFPPEFPHEFVQVVHAVSIPIVSLWSPLCLVCIISMIDFTWWFIFMITSKLRSKVFWLRLTHSFLLICVNVKRLCVRGGLKLKIEDHDVLTAFQFTFADGGAISTVIDLCSCLDCRYQHCMFATPFCQKLNAARGHVISAFDRCLATGPVPFLTPLYNFFQKLVSTCWMSNRHCDHCCVRIHIWRAIWWSRINNFSDFILLRCFWICTWALA